MSRLLVCSTVRRPYPRVRGNAQRLLADVEIDRIFLNPFSPLHATQNVLRKLNFIDGVRSLDRDGYKAWRKATVTRRLREKF
jgi:hypothetical protein